MPSSDLDPFPADGAYAGTARLDTSADCKGTFTVGLFPPPKSVLVDQDNEFMPLIGFKPARITCEIGRCCFDLDGAGGCWENVTQLQCADAPAPAYWDPDPSKTCDDACVDCIDDAFCQDGNWCNGFEVCDEMSRCAPGPIQCDDGIVCTVDVCNEVEQTCTFIADDSLCDDGQWCSGDERCDPIAGCEFGTPPCEGRRCFEGVDRCEPIPIPAVSTWGLAILGGILLVLAKVCFRARGRQYGRA